MTSWKEDEKGWRVLRADGTWLANEWYQAPDSGLWYYIGADGYMMTNSLTPDGYYVGADGVWAEEQPAAQQEQSQQEQQQEQPKKSLGIDMVFQYIGPYYSENSDEDIIPEFKEDVTVSVSRTTGTFEFEPVIINGVEGWLNSESPYSDWITVGYDASAHPPIGNMGRINFAEGILRLRTVEGPGNPETYLDKYGSYHENMGIVRLFHRVGANGE